MKKLFLLAIACCLSYTSILADEAPVNVSLEYRTTLDQQTGRYFDYPNVIITALQDNVEIFYIDGNSGDYKPLPYVNPGLPKTIHRGQRLEYAFFASTCPRLIDLEIEANDVTYNFTFN